MRPVFELLLHACSLSHAAGAVAAWRRGWSGRRAPDVASVLLRRRRRADLRRHDDDTAAVD